MKRLFLALVLLFTSSAYGQDFYRREHLYRSLDLYPKTNGGAQLGKTNLAFSSLTLSDGTTSWNGRIAVTGGGLMEIGSVGGLNVVFMQGGAYVLGYNATSFYPNSNGGMTLGNGTNDFSALYLSNAGVRASIQSVDFGFGAGYEALEINSGNRDHPIAFNVDINSNSGGSFAGTGKEFFFPNGTVLTMELSSGTDFGRAIEFEKNGAGVILGYKAVADLPSTCTSGAILKVHDSDDCSTGSGNGALCVCNNAGTGFTLLLNY